MLIFLCSGLVLHSVHKPTDLKICQTCQTFHVLICLQEVEYVKEEAKMVYLLECLQKTPPPVSISTYYDNDTTKINLKTILNVFFLHLDRC